MASLPRLRAAVLAAGHGRRLHPLTDFAPKPLLPVAGQPIAGHTLSLLAAVGVEAAALNLHHLGDEIRERFGSSYAGLPLTYSIEKELLGTLGALRPLREFLQAAELIVVVNGDSLCRWPIKRLVKRHLKSRAAATLLLTRRAAVASFGGGLGIDRQRRVVSVRPGVEHGPVARRRVFCGAHVLSPELLGELPEGRAEFLEDLYEPLLSRGAQIAAMETSRPWHDLGTPRRFLAAALEWGRKAGQRGNSWIDPTAEVAANASVRRAVVEAGARVEAGAVIEESALLPGSRAGRGSRVVHSILGFGAVLPPGCIVERRLVTPARATSIPRPRDSVMSGLVYSPLEDGE